MTIVYLSRYEMLKREQPPEDEQGSEGEIIVKKLGRTVKNSSLQSPTRPIQRTKPTSSDKRNQGYGNICEKAIKIKARKNPTS